MNYANSYVTDWNLKSDAARAARVLIGGVCIDEHLFFDQFALARKNTVCERTSSIGGGAANGARVHRVLVPETPIILLAAVGADRIGHDIRRHMNEQRIDMPWSPIAGGETSLSFILNHAGVSTVAMVLGVREEPVPLELLDAHLNRAEACCLVSPNNAAIAPVIHRAAMHGVKVYFGLGSSQIRGLSLEALRREIAGPVEMVICNRGEAENLTGRTDDDELLEALHAATQSRYTIITDGASGIFGLGDGSRVRVEAYHDLRPSIDDIGAGDAAQATIAHYLIGGASLAEAMRAGARQGFEVTTARGTTAALVGAEDLRRHLEGVLAA